MSVVSETSSFSRIRPGEAKGSLRCAACGYEIVSYRSLPACPMCRNTCWEPAPWRPFTRNQVEGP